MSTFRTTAWMVLIVVVMSAYPLAAQTATQPAAGAVAEDESGGPGTVTADNVYVRSGFAKNYYPVLKLQKGDKVKVVGSSYGWLEILPPPGAYSLVEKSRIDKTGDAGVANDLTQVYAGSDLDKSRYAKQVKLSKGERVQIIGETPEGDFYKITPPAGATLWISADYVKRGPGADFAAIEPVKDLKKAQAELKTTATKPAGTVDKSKPRKEFAPAPRPAPAPQLKEENRVAMRAIEAKIAAEMVKAPTDRSFESIIGELKHLADQPDDTVAQLYAKTQIENLRGQAEIAAAILELRQLREDAIKEADVIAAERARIRANQPPPFDPYRIVARGEIRVSGLYDGSGGKAKRWRLVDPKTNRSIAYIELPPGSPIDPVQFYGKYVGVRAISYELLHGTVPPLPVYVINDIRVLDPNASGSPGVVSKEELASPFPPVAAAPASRPALETTTTRPATPAGSND